MGYRQQIVGFDEIAQKFGDYAFQDFADCAFEGDGPVICMSSA